MAKKNGSKNKQHQNNNRNNNNSVQVRAAKGRTTLDIPSGSAIAPVSYFKERKSYFKVTGGNADSIRVKGCDYLTTCGWLTTAATGSMLANVLICPGAGALVNTRLGRFAQLYEKYIFSKLIFHVQSGCATSQTGAYIISYDRDVSDPTPPAGPDAVRQYLAHAGARSGSAWESISIVCPLTDTQKFYYTNPSSGGDERLAYQGQLYLAVMTPISSNQNMNLWVEYECIMMDPQLESQVVETKVAATSGSTSNTSRAAWNNLSTVVLENSITPIIQDSSGNKGVQLPPGTWFIEQALQQSTAGGNQLGTPTVLDLLSGADVTSAVSTTMDTVYQNVLAVANSSGYRADKVTNNGPGFLGVFGNLSVSGQTIANQFMRVFEMDGTYVA